MHPNIIKMYKERCGEFIFRFFHHTLRKLRASYRERSSLPRRNEMKPGAVSAVFVFWIRLK